MSHIVLTRAGTELEQPIYGYQLQHMYQSYHYVLCIYRFRFWLSCIASYRSFRYIVSVDVSVEVGAVIGVGHSQSCVCHVFMCNAVRFVRGDCGLHHVVFSDQISTCVGQLVIIDTSFTF
jgi:hypothetical protein